MVLYKGEQSEFTVLSKNPSHLHDLNMEGLLLESLNAQRQSKILCDVVLIVQREEFPAHKGILAANSNYFMALFTTNMIEREQERVILKEVNPSAVREILNFVYTGQLTVQKDSVRDLLQASSFLLVTRVKDACCDYLETILEVDNCLTIISIADEFYCERLYRKAVRFLFRKFLQVAKTEEFMSLTADEIKELLSSDDICVDDEAQLFEVLASWVKYKQEIRRKHLPQLLQVVRLHFLQPEYLETSVVYKELTVPRDFTGSSRRLNESLTSKILSPRKSYSKISVILVAGGVDDSKILDSVCCYIPSTNKWCDLGKMNSPRWRLEMITTETSALAFSGLNEVSTTHPEIPYMEKYDARSDSWEVLPNTDLPFPVDNDSYRAVKLGNEVIFVGSRDPWENSSMARVFSVRDLESAPKFEPLAPMLVRRTGHAVVASSGHVYVIGGSPQALDGNTPLGENTVERYDRQKDTWSTISPMTQPRCHCSAISVENKIFVFGGCHGHSTLQSAEVYDPLTDRWSFIAPMRTPRMNFATAVHDGKVWVIGGISEPRGCILKTVERYDPNTDSWTTVAPMCCKRRYFQCCVTEVAFRTVASAFEEEY